MVRRPGNGPNSPKLDEIALVSEKPLKSGLKFDARCKVCKKGENFVGMVNTLLVTGASYMDVLRAIEPANNAYPEEQRVSYMSLRNHQKRHLPYDEYAIRKILEARAERQKIDFEKGVQSIVTPAAYAEVMMQKAFGRLVSGEEDVTLADGLNAAKTLHVLTAGEDSNQEVLRMMAQLSRIIDAVKQVTTPDQMRRITEILNADGAMDEGSMIEAEVVEDAEIEEG